MMKNKISHYIFYLSIIFIFSLLINYKNLSKADKKWAIKKFKKLTYAKVSGEIQHGDALSFFILAEDNCNKIWNTFTFLTFERPGDIKQLLHKHLPIKLNGLDLTAKVEDIKSFSRGYKVMFSLGVFPIREYVYFLNEFYTEEKKYEIEIVDGINFKAEKYFDIRLNNWKLENLVVSISKANKLCKEIITNTEKL